MAMLQARREWQEISHVRLLYPTRLSIKMEGQIRSFPNKRSLKEYNSTKPALQEMLNRLLQGKKGKERERERGT